MEQASELQPIATAAASTRASSEPDGAAWILIGFALFGSVLGFTTAASSHDGVSDTLISALVTFVGGAFLTFAGFRHQLGTSEVSPKRVGMALAALSLGIWLGVGGGIGLRWRYERPFPAGAAAARTNPHQILLHGGQADMQVMCARTRRRIDEKDFAGPASTLAVLDDFVKAVCE